MTPLPTCHIVFAPADQRDALCLWRALEAAGIPAKLDQRVSDATLPTANSALPEAAEHLLLVSSGASHASLAVSATVNEFIQQHGRENVLPIVSSLTGSEVPIEDLLSPLLKFERRAGDRLLQPADYIPDILGDLRFESPEKIVQRIRSKLDRDKNGAVTIEMFARWARQPAIAWTGAGVAAAAALLMAVNIAALRSDNASLELAAHQARQSTAQMFAELEDSLSAEARQEVFTQIGDDLIANTSIDTDQSAEALLANARVLHVIGNARVREGDIDGALEAFNLAATATQTLLVTQPDNPNRIYEHAQSVFWIGDAAFQAGRYDIASPQYEAYAELARQLVEIDPQDPVYRGEWAYAQLNLGVAATGYDEREEALAYFQSAISLFQDGLVEAGVIGESSVANAYGWTAGPLRSLGRINEAISARSEEAAILLRLLEANPDSRRLQLGYVNAIESRALILLDLGEIEAIENDLAVITPIISRLREELPTSRSIRRHHLDVEMLRARLALYRGDLIAAQLISSAAARDYASGNGSQIEDDRHIDLGRHDLQRAEIALTAGAYEAALTTATEAAADFESDIDSEGSRLRHFAALANFYRGESLAALGQPGEAQRAWRTGLAQVQTLSAPRDPRADDVASRLMYRLGDRETAQNLRNQIQEDGYARPDFLAFWQAPETPVSAAIYEEEGPSDG